jgi:hypothetical protein
MGPYVINNYGTVLLIQAIFIMLFMFPDYSLILWKVLAKKWTLTGEKRIMKRRRASGEKIKKYWEIDMRKFK